MHNVGAESEPPEMWANKTVKDGEGDETDREESERERENISDCPKKFGTLQLFSLH